MQQFREDQGAVQPEAPQRQMTEEEIGIQVRQKMNEIALGIYTRSAAMHGVDLTPQKAEQLCSAALDGAIAAANRFLGVTVKREEEVKSEPIQEFIPDTEDG